MVSERVWSALTPLLPELRSVTPRLSIAGTAAPVPAEIAALSLDSIAAEVLEAASRAGLERFHLVGHSMGGQIAQLVAATAPERLRSLALVNPVPLGGLPLPDAVAAAFRGSGGNRTAQGAIVDQACRELASAAKASLLDDAGEIAPAWIARAFDVWTAGGDAAKLARVSCPTLVVATDDPFLPPPFLEAALVSRIATARLEVLKGPGHYPQIERPDALAAVLRAFFADVQR